MVKPKIAEVVKHEHGDEPAAPAPAKAAPKPLTEAQVLKRAETLLAHLSPRAQDRVVTYLSEKAKEAHELQAVQP